MQVKSKKRFVTTDDIHFKIVQEINLQFTRKHPSLPGSIKLTWYGSTKSHCTHDDVEGTSDSQTLLGVKNRLVVQRLKRKFRKRK